MVLFKPNVEKMEAKRDVKGLTKALKHHDTSIRARSALALERLGWKPKDDAERLNYLIAKNDWNELAKLAEPTVKPLIKAYRSERDNSVRRGIVSALGKRGDAKGQEFLVKVLGKDPDSQVRCEAATGLAEIGDARAIGPLIKALKEHPDGRVSDAAKWALAKIGEPALVSMFLYLFKGKDSSDDFKRHRVARAFGGQGGEKATRLLIQALKDKETNRSTRVYMADALGEIGGEKATEALIQALTDEDVFVRNMAAIGLGKIADPRAVDPLIHALKDVSTAYGWKGWKVRDAATLALSQIGDQAVEPLIQALKNEDWLVQYGAARALGEIGDTRAIEPLTIIKGQYSRLSQNYVYLAAKSSLKLIETKKGSKSK